jgi:hypothetical protein
MAKAGLLFSIVSAVLGGVIILVKKLLVILSEL